MSTEMPAALNHFLFIQTKSETLRRAGNHKRENIVSHNSLETKHRSVVTNSDSAVMRLGKSLRREESVPSFIREGKGIYIFSSTVRMKARVKIHSADTQNFKGEADCTERFTMTVQSLFTCGALPSTPLS